MWKNSWPTHRTRFPFPSQLQFLFDPPSLPSAGRVPHIGHSLSTPAEESVVITEMTVTLKPDFGINDCLFPLLPRINNSVIERQVFTHRSFFARAAHLFEDSINDLSPDNEKFELLGDSVLQTCITTLLMEMYPGLRVGPATKVRAMMVANFTLAQISVKYKLPECLLLHPAQAITLRASTNIRANVFESFIGGLFRDQGLEAVMRWVIPLFRPYAVAAYAVAREQHGLPPPRYDPAQISGRGMIAMQVSPHPEPTDLANMPTVGHLALFNQHLQKLGKSVEWNYIDEVDKQVAPSTRGTKATPVWFVTVLVDGVFHGSGRGGTKKAARNEAAKAGLVQLGIQNTNGWEQSAIAFCRLVLDTYPLRRASPGVQ